MGRNKICCSSILPVQLSLLSKYEEKVLRKLGYNIRITIRTFCRFERRSKRKDIARDDFSKKGFLEHQKLSET